MISNTDNNKQTNISTSTVFLVCKSISEIGDHYANNFVLGY